MEPNEDHKNKFANIFTRINVILTERKKESSKTYFKKISFKSLFLILSMTTLVILSYVDIFEYKNTSKGYLFLVPLIVSALIVLALFKTKKIYYFVYYSVPALIIGYTISYFAKSEGLATVGMILSGISFGIICAIAIICFLFMMNMSERLIAALLILFLIFSLSLINILNIPALVMHYIFPMILCILSYVALFMVDRESISDFTTNNEIMPKAPVVLLIILIAIILINCGIITVIEKQVHNSSIEINRSYYSISYYIGFLLSTIIGIVTFLYTKRSIVLLSIIYFIGAVGAFQLGIIYQLFPAIKVWRQTMDVAMGFTFSTGILCILMMTGKILENKASRNTFYTVMMFLLFDVLGAFFLYEALKDVSIRVILVAMVILMFFGAIIFIGLSIFGSFEVKRTKNTPVGYMERNQQRYKFINPEEVLTPKEKSIFDLLLEGLTLRQIAAELSMKYDTVNFHYKNIYRKLEVNSKVELFVRYGQTH